MSTKTIKGVNAVSVTVFIFLIALDIGIVYFLSLTKDSRMVAVAIGVLAALFIAASVKIADQWEKGVVLRMGKFIGLKGPGLFFIFPIVERVDNYIDQRLRVTDVRAEQTLTKDTVPVTVDAVVYSQSLIRGFGPPASKDAINPSMGAPLWPSWPQTPVKQVGPSPF